MSRAVIGEEFGAPESYRLQDHDPGPPGAGQVRVGIRAAGISYVDVLIAMGRYQVKPPLPFVPGSEFAGVVEAVGDGVRGFAPGDRVFGAAMGGVFADTGIFAATSLKPVPEGMAMEAAAVFMPSYQTALYALVDRGALQPGETVLVLGAAGGTGYATTQLAKHLGARVIASASSEEKRRLALQAGADAVVESGAQDWRDQVRAANDGRPVDIVFDPVGGDFTDLAFRTLGYGGRHLVIGFTAGMTALRTNLPMLKSASLVGVQLRHFTTERPEEAAANSRTIYELARQGVLRPAIGMTCSIEDYAPAMNAAFAGKTAGRIVMTMAG